VTAPKTSRAAPKAAAPKAPREKKVSDFRAIGLDWLPGTPADPQILAQFSSDQGDFETYYHYAFDSDAALYLLFDRRCKFGRFLPKMGNTLFTLKIEGQTYQGALWREAIFELGVLEITPFLKALEPSVPQEEPEEISQTSLIAQDNYDYWS
jgi:hypothetical protein